MSHVRCITYTVHLLNWWNWSNENASVSMHLPHHWILFPERQRLINITPFLRVRLEIGSGQVEAIQSYTTKGAHSFRYFLLPISYCCLLMHVCIFTAKMHMHEQTTIGYLKEEVPEWVCALLWCTTVRQTYYLPATWSAMKENVVPITAEDVGFDCIVLHWWCELQQL